MLPSWLRFLARTSCATNPGKAWPPRRRAAGSFSPGLERLEDRLAPAVDVWTGASPARSNNWSDGANWSLGTAPKVDTQVLFTTDPNVLMANGLGANAVQSTFSNVDPAFAGMVAQLTIDGSWGGVITVNKNLAVSSGFTLSSGSFGGNGAVTVAGTSQWNGGTLFVGSGGLTNTGTLTADTTNVGLALAGGGTLVNKGTIHLAGLSNLQLQFSTTLSNAAGATLDFMDDASINTLGGGTLSNAGTIEKTGGGSFSSINTTFFNLKGTLDAESGTLVLASIGGSMSSGQLLAGVQGSKSATLALTAPGGRELITGTFTGFGMGTVALTSGILAIGSMGATFNLPGSLFQWTGGTIDVSSGGTLTNAPTGSLNLDTTGGNFGLLGAGGLVNNGTINLAGTNSFYLVNNVTLTNAVKGTFNFTDDGTINQANGGTLVNAGLLAKTGGMGTSAINSTFRNNGAVISVQTGTLALGGGGGSLVNGGVFKVGSGAVLDLTGGASESYTGLFTGSGPGAVQVGNGTLVVTSAGATFNFPGNLFQWTRGTIDVGSGGTLTNAPGGVINLNSPFGDTLSGAGTLINNGLVRLAGPGNLTLAYTATFSNTPKGTINFTGDETINAYYSGTLLNAGGIFKTGGTGTSSISTAFTNNGGTLDAESGTLNLASYAGFLNSGRLFAGAAANASPQARLDLTGQARMVIAGNFTGSGAGTVALDSGTLVVASAGATFNLPGSLFQWTNGGLDLSSGGTFTNAPGSTLTLDTSSNNLDLSGAGTLVNNGTINLAGSNTLYLVNNVTLNNTSKGVFEFTSDGNITQVGGGNLINAGSLAKTGGGTSPSQINSTLLNTGGSIDLRMGTLALGGAGGSLINGALFLIAQGATLDLTGGATVNCLGTITGAGSGTVLLRNGTLAVAAKGVTFNMPGNLFQWTGGTIDVSSGGTLTNAATSVLNLNASNGPTLSGAGTLVNKGVINLFQTGSLILQYDALLNNAKGATLNISGNAGIGQNGIGTLSNSGLLGKGGDPSSSSNINCIFFNIGAPLLVSSGTLFLNVTGGSLLNGGTLTVAAGATLDLTGNQTVNYTGTFTGGGGGTVALDAGTLAVTKAGATFNLPGSMFQWSGGGMDVSSGGTFTNAGVLNLNLTATSVALAGNGMLLNNGIFNLSGSNNLFLQRNATLTNARGATLNLSGNTTLAQNFSGVLNNAGLIEKTGGGSSSIGSAILNNTGAVQVLSGTLTTNSLTNTGTLTLGPASILTVLGTFSQGPSGLLDVQLGGTPGSGLFGQLTVNSNSPAMLGGTLKSELVNGYLPAAGDSFTIMNFNSKVGNFAHFNLGVFQPQVNPTNVIISH